MSDNNKRMDSFYESRMKDLLFEINRASEQSSRVVEVHKSNEMGIHNLHGFMIGSLTQFKNIIETSLEYGGELKEASI